MLWYACESYCLESREERQDGLVGEKYESILFIYLVVINYYVACSYYITFFLLSVI